MRPRRHGKGSGARRGFRVWRVKLENAGELKRRLAMAMLYGVQGLPRCLLWYSEEYRSMVKASLYTRRTAGMGYLERLPPVPLLVKFVESGRVVHGATNAGAVVDLSRGELRIPSLGVRLRLKRSMVRALKEEIQRFEDISFTLFVSEKGFSLVASRETSAWYSGEPLRVVGVDLNSRHGVTIIAMDYSPREGWRMRGRWRLQPPNGSYREDLAALIQALGARGEQGYVEWWKERSSRGEEYILRLVYKLFEIPLNPTPSSWRRTAGEARSTRKLNEDFMKKLTALLRGAVRDGVDHGRHVVVVVDEPDYSSLHGTELQKTLLRVTRRLSNLCYYEGAGFLSLRVSGKRCPVCGARGVEAGGRKYQCPRCGVKWDRDLAASFNAAKAYLSLLSKKTRNGEEKEILLNMEDTLREWAKANWKSLGA